MYTCNDDFISQRKHDFRKGQHVSDAAHFLLHDTDKHHFTKDVLTETNNVQPEFDSNPGTTGLVGQPLDAAIIGDVPTEELKQ